MKKFIKKILLLLYLLPISAVANRERKKEEPPNIKKIMTAASIVSFIGTYTGIKILNSINDNDIDLSFINEDFPLLLSAVGSITGRYLTGESIKKSTLAGVLSGAGGIGLTLLIDKLGILNVIKSWLITDENGYVNEESYFRFGIKNKQIFPLITFCSGAVLTTQLTEILIKKLEKHNLRQKEKNVNPSTLSFVEEELIEYEKNHNIDKLKKKGFYV